MGYGKRAHAPGADLEDAPQSTLAEPSAQLDYRRVEALHVADLHHRAALLRRGQDGLDVVAVASHQVIRATVALDPVVQAVPDPADVIRQQLAALDSAYPVTQRNLREITLALAQVIEAVTAQPAAANRGVQAVTAVEAEAEVLRNQLKAIEKGGV